MTFYEAEKIVKQLGGLYMAKADIIFLTEYERSSPYWKNVILAVEVLSWEVK